jgi:hypothetical protein
MLSRDGTGGSGDASTSPAKERDAKGTGSSGVRRNPQFAEVFLDFFRIFDAPLVNERLFPKDCRTCGRRFKDLGHYLDKTLPKGHVMEDCSDVMDRSYTMMYRHCPCGNTLITVFTEETIPILDRMWETFREEAERSGIPLKEFVREFNRQLDLYVKSGRGPRGSSSEES